MVLETVPQTFWQWLIEPNPATFGLPTLAIWLLTLLALVVVGALVSFLALAFNRGLGEAGDAVYQALLSATVDVLGLSPRRVLAIARLAIAESVRRKALAAVLVFFVILAFAGWFLDPDSPEPAVVYLNFVLTLSGWLTLLVVLFLSTLSLPNDIKQRTIYTVVTKPVRSSEIVLGRILGFVAIGTCLLVVMSLVSYAFSRRALNHAHDPSDLVLVDPQTGEVPPNVVLRRSRSGGHFHVVRQLSDGRYVTDTDQGHWHEVDLVEANGTRQLVAGAPQGYFAARVPVYGKLGFIDREGNRTQKGINVGNEWEYRSYIDGGTLAAAIWDFSGLDDLPEADFSVVPEGAGWTVVQVTRDSPAAVAGLQTGDVFAAENGAAATSLGSLQAALEAAAGGTLTVQRGGEAASLALPTQPLRTALWEAQATTFELTLRVFRTHKGNIERTVLGSLVFRNPKTGLESGERTFPSREFYTDRHSIPRDLRDAEGKPLDFFQDLVADGQVQVLLKCVPRGQFFGVAQADLYVLKAEANYFLNFVRAQLGVWLQMVLICSFGVMWSTFLNGAVAMLATVATLVGGFFCPFLEEVALNKIEGGGPIEALYRLGTQANIITDLDAGAATNVIKGADVVFRAPLFITSRLLPNLGGFDNTQYVARGFHVPTDLLLIQLGSAIGFFLPVFVLGFLFLKLREVAK